MQIVRNVSKSRNIVGRLLLLDRQLTLRSLDLSKIVDTWSRRFSGPRIIKIHGNDSENRHRKCENSNAKDVLLRHGMANDLREAAPDCDSREPKTLEAN